VRIDVAAAPATLRVRVGTLGANASSPAMGRVTLAKNVTLTRPGPIVLPVPEAPFRVEVRYGSGARGSIRFSPLP
jgi:hypothetical protein